MFINAEQAKKISEKVYNEKIAYKNIKPEQKILKCNENKAYFIPLPFKMPIVENIIARAVENGEKFAKIDNEITNEVEEELIKNGYKVKWCKNYVKVEW